MNDDLIGTDLGQYHLTESIGRGGMATVYKAYQPALDRSVAIKVLPYNSDPQFASRFKIEARTLARLQHPHILPIYDYGERTSMLYLVLQYIENGISLGDMLGRPLAPRVALRLMMQLLSALDYAHRHNVIHRDIKPPNILMAAPNWSMLADFGIAKLLNDSQQNLTSPGLIMGTAAYMAPEQALGRPIDARTDLYATGIVLYEMLTGRVPFDGDTPLVVLTKHVYEAPLPPRRINPDLPPAVEALLLRAIEKDPDARYQSAAELAAELEQLMDQMAQPAARSQLTHLYQAGAAAFQEERWDVAVDQLSRLVALDPSYQDGLVLLKSARAAQDQLAIEADHLTLSTEDDLEEPPPHDRGLPARVSPAPSTPVVEMGPLLDSLAHLVVRNTPINDGRLHTLLIEAGLRSEPNTVGELKRWSTLLVTLRQQPSAELRRTTAEALLARGLSEVTVASAVDTIVSATAAPTVAFGSAQAPSATDVDQLAPEAPASESDQIAADQRDLQNQPDLVLIRNGQTTDTPQQYVPPASATTPRSQSPPAAPLPHFVASMPPPARQRISTDYQQLQEAGYPTMLASEPDGVLLTCDLPRRAGLSYTVAWQCSMVYPGVAPRLSVVEQGFDDYGQIQHNQLTFLLPQLNRWSASVTLLEVLREIEQQLEEGRFAASPVAQSFPTPLPELVAPAPPGGPEMPAALGPRDIPVTSPSTDSLLDQLPVLDKVILPPQAPSLPVQRQQRPARSAILLIGAVAGAVVIFLLALVIVPTRPDQTGKAAVIVPLAATVPLAPTTQPAATVPLAPAAPSACLAPLGSGGSASSCYASDLEATLLANGYTANSAKVAGSTRLIASATDPIQGVWARDLDYATSGYAYVLNDMKVLRDSIALLLEGVKPDGEAPEGRFSNQKNYVYGQTWDSMPNLIHAVYAYVAKTGDGAFYEQHRDGLQRVGGWIVKLDSDDDGLPDRDIFPYGYYNSVRNSVRHTYALAKFYAAFNELAELERYAGHDGSDWAQRAQRLHDGFHRPFDAGGYWIENQAWPIAWRGADGSPVNLLETFGVFEALRAGLIAPNDGAHHQSLIAALHDTLPQLIDGPMPMRLALGGYDRALLRDVVPQSELWKLDASALWIVGIAAPAYAAAGYPDDAKAILEAYMKVARSGSMPRLIAGPNAGYGAGQEGGGGAWEQAAWFLAVYSGHYGLLMTPDALIVQPHPYVEVPNDGIRNLVYQGVTVQLALDVERKVYSIRAEQKIHVVLHPIGGASQLRVDGGESQQHVELELQAGREYVIVSGET